MGLFGAIAAAVAGAASSVLATATALLSTISAAVVAAVAVTVSAVSAVVTSLTAAVVNIVLDTIGSVYAGVADIVTTLVELVTPVYAKVSAVVETLYDTFQTFLEIIHFKTLTEIHSIAYIVSDEYRKQWDKIWMQLQDFAAAVNVPLQYYQLAMQSARTVVLNTSAFLGRRYDIAEVTWLKEFNKVIEAMNSKATAYKENPSQIWHDINELIYQPTIDTHAAAQKGIFLTIENTLNSMKNIVNEIELRRGQVDEILRGLPKKWRQELGEEVNKVWGVFDKFRNEIYSPALYKINQVIDVLYIRQNDAKTNLRDLSARIARGGDLLSEIDTLPEDIRIEQEDKISEISSRTFKRNTAAMLKAGNKEYMSLKAISDAITPPSVPAVWYVTEKQGITLPIGKQTATRDSWFCGDY